MQESLEFAAFWIVAAIVVLVVVVGGNEWRRVRQFKENLKANGRRK